MNCTFQADGFLRPWQTVVGWPEKACRGRGPQDARRRPWCLRHRCSDHRRRSTGLVLALFCSTRLSSSWTRSAFFKRWPSADWRWQGQHPTSRARP